MGFVFRERKTQSDRALVRFLGRGTARLRELVFGGEEIELAAPAESASVVRELQFQTGVDYVPPPEPVVPAFVEPPPPAELPALRIVPPPPEPAGADGGWQLAEPEPLHEAALELEPELAPEPVETRDPAVVPEPPAIPIVVIRREAEVVAAQQELALPLELEEEEPFFLPHTELEPAAVHDPFATFWLDPTAPSPEGLTPGYLPPLTPLWVMPTGDKL